MSPITPLSTLGREPNHSSHRKSAVSKPQFQIAGVIGVWLVLLAGNALAPSLDCPWTLTSAPSTNWSAVASSADGAKLVGVVGGGLIYVSTNSGDTWTATSAPSNRWSAVASSADGIRLIAAGSPGPIFFSTNSGGTWIPAAVPVNYWTSLAMSADGVNLAAVVRAYSTQQVMYVSSDSAATWNEANAPSEYLTAISISADGTKWVLASSSGSFGYKQNIFASTNFGASWVQTVAPSKDWHSIATSADGSRIAVAPRGRPGGNPVTYVIAEPIYLSSDSGVSWNPTTVTNDWTGIASSADGSELIAVTRGSIRSSTVPDGGLTQISTNSGASWITNIVPHASWTGVASSADGSRVVAVAGTASWGDSPAPGIYTLHAIPSPVLQVKTSADRLSLSWIVPSLKFILQQNSNLQPANWSDVTAAPVLNTTNLQYEATFARSNASTFYRLRSQ